MLFLKSHWLGLNLLLMDLLQLQEKQCSEVVIGPASRTETQVLCCNLYYSVVFFFVNYCKMEIIIIVLIGLLKRVLSAERD